MKYWIMVNGVKNYLPQWKTYDYKDHDKGTDYAYYKMKDGKHILDKKGVDLTYEKFFYERNY